MHKLLRAIAPQQETSSLLFTTHREGLEQIRITAVQSSWSGLSSPIRRKICLHTLTNTLISLRCKFWCFLIDCVLKVKGNLCNITGNVCNSAMVYLHRLDGGVWEWIATPVLSVLVKMIKLNQRPSLINVLLKLNH